MLTSENTRRKSKILSYFNPKRRIKAKSNLIHLVKQMKDQGVSNETISQLTGISSRWID